MTTINSCEPMESAKVPPELTRDNWKDRDTEVLCQTCRFYEPKMTQAIGRCRKRAPKVGKGWPVVYPADWCGDHKLS